MRIARANVRESRRVPARDSRFQMGHKKRAIAGTCVKPSNGLEPLTPSLPFKFELSRRVPRCALVTIKPLLNSHFWRDARGRRRTMRNGRMLSRSCLPRRTLRWEACPLPLTSRSKYRAGVLVERPGPLPHGVGERRVDDAAGQVVRSQPLRAAPAGSLKPKPT
jgi:hypothetical protein